MSVSDKRPTRAEILSWRPTVDNIELSSLVATALLKLIALPYAGHPDYREEWRPA
jgi:hypothetical protein